MKLFLRDRNPAMHAAWQEFFGDEEDVNVSCGNIFDKGDHMKVDAIVSPANSFGFMDGGIDYCYSRAFGWEMSKELQQLIREEHHGELLVGQAQVVDIRHTFEKTPIPFLISAPTMRVPEVVAGTVNAYLAFRAAVREAKRHPDINSMLCPGLGTAVGEMPYPQCARQMYAAYKGSDPNYNNFAEAQMDQQILLLGAGSQ